jgi:hypothetical protein
MATGVAAVAETASHRSHRWRGEKRHRATRIAMPIGNSEVSSAGASIGGMPM